MANVTVKFFGLARDIAGNSSITLQTRENESLGTLAGRLAEQYPRLGAAVGIRLALNRQYVALDHTLADGDEVAVIPPVSGGSPDPRIRLTTIPIDVAAMAGELADPRSGAVVTFAGVVRAELQDDRRLLALEYHAYEEMAFEQMSGVRKRALQSFEILDAAIIHRLGRLPIGEPSVGIVVLAAHRSAAFDACRWIIDQIKTDVPIWKQDLWSDGTKEWVDPTGGAPAAPPA